MRTRTRQHRTLAALDLFAGCTPPQIETIDRLGTEIVVPAGTPVWHEGRTEAQFVIVLDGQIDLTRAGEPVVTLAAGACFGHDALLNGRRTEVVSGTVTTPTRLFAFSKREFTSLLHAVPAVTASLTPIPSVPRTAITTTPSTRSNRIATNKTPNRERAALLTHGAIR